MQTIAADDHRQVPDVRAARQIAEELAASAWAFAALSACAEYGVIERLDGGKTAGEVASACGLPVAVATGLLDVLVAVGLAYSDTSRYAASPGAAAASATFPGVVRAFGRASQLQVHDLYERARHRALDEVGWRHTDPDLLQAQGEASAGFADGFEHVVLPRLTGLRERLHAPQAAFLDVGAGVGAISIELCRRFPALRCVALEPQDAPVALARENVQRAELGPRVEVRRQRIEELDDVERFDLVWLPLPFIAPDAVETAIQRMWRALRPGGWALVASIDSQGDGLTAAVSRLRCALWGGAPLADAALAAALRRVGFAEIRPSAQIPMPMAPTGARKPSGG